MTDSLNAKSKMLDEKAKDSAPVYAMRLDLMKNIINDLDSNTELQEIFGDPVSSKLALVSDGRDKMVSIAEARMVELDEAKTAKFLEVLQSVLEKNLAGVEINEGTKK